MPLSRRSLLAGTASAALGALAACAGSRRRAAVATAPSVPAGGAPPPGPAPRTTAPPSAPATPAGGRARFIRSGPAGSRGVALTFHGSGDPALAAALLDAARRLQVPITVFAVGQWLESQPTLARRLLAEGHELANHTYTHPALGTLGGAAVATEVRRCRDVLVAVTGGDGRWFRPSGMDVPSPLVLDRAGAEGYGTVVGYDVDPRDYQDPGRDAIVQRVAAGMRPGSIVSLHTGHAGTVAAFEPMVAAARSRGLTPMVVSRLLATEVRG